MASGNTEGKYVYTYNISRKVRRIGMTRKRHSYVPIERNTFGRINERMSFAAEISRIRDNNLVVQN